MNCEKASELLPGLLAGALGREEELEVLSHLARCGECRRELAFWAQVAEVVKADKAVMPGEVFEGIREELFGVKVPTVLESLKLTGRALGLAGSACKLAFTAAGLNS